MATFHYNHEMINSEHSNAKSSQLFGSQLPTAEDFQAIILQMRSKYGLPPLQPGDDGITEIYLGDRLVPLEEFRQEIFALVRDDPHFLPPDTARQYARALELYGKPFDPAGLETVSVDLLQSIHQLYDQAQQMMEMTIKMVNTQLAKITKMVYVYLLTGETEEVPNDWISQVIPLTLGGEPVVMAFASQTAERETIVQLFRKQFDKTFGGNRPKLTDKVVSTGYYIALQRLGKPWSYILSEFIRLEKLQLPRDTKTKRYADTRQKFEQRLRKRIKKTQIVMDIYTREIK